MKRLILAGLMLVAAVARLPAAETNAIPMLTLAEACQLALRQHPRVAAAQYQAGAADEAVKEARSAELPSANLYGTAAGANIANDRILAGDINNPSVYDRVAGGLNVSQLITDFGHTANLKASSQFAARAENENAADVREQVWLQAATSYYGVLEAQAVLQVARETVQSRKLLLEQVTTQVAGHTICAFGEAASWPIQGLMRAFGPMVRTRAIDYVAPPALQQEWRRTRSRLRARFVFLFLGLILSLWPSPLRHL